MTYGTKGEPVRCLVSVGPMIAAKASSEGWHLRLRPNNVTWPSTLPPGWTVEWDTTPVGEDQEE
jgi:acyl-coenzyme A synthetase/AMP-(fatty) acid ligase